MGGNAVDQVKKVGSEVAVKAKKVGSAVISGIGDVFDYIGHPGKLVNKIFDKVGFNFNFLKDAPLPFDLMQGAYKKLKVVSNHYLTNGLMMPVAAMALPLLSFQLIWDIILMVALLVIVLVEVIITVLTLAHLLVRQSTLRIADS